MQSFKPIPPTAISDNLFSRIGESWMLITAATPDGRVNTMTASWGCTGILWNKPVALCFIRPQRYTYGIVEAGDTLSLAFFPQGEHRETLRYCGTMSGREVDKLAATGLTVERTSDGTPFPAQADLVLICRKLYADDLKEGCFLDPALLKHYTARDYHRFYVCEITRVLVKDSENTPS